MKHNKEANLHFTFLPQKTHAPTAFSGVAAFHIKGAYKTPSNIKATRKNQAQNIMI